MFTEENYHIYDSVLKAFDRGCLCRGCENKIFYGTYYEGIVSLCKYCKVYETIDCETTDLDDLIEVSSNEDYD